MKTQTKVAGTSFHPLPENQFIRIRQSYEFEGIPCADVDAILMPEPDNQFDPDAVKVMVPLESGEAFHIGYLPEKSELKQLINKTYVATIMIKNFALKNPQYSPSWIITEVNGL